jgi:cell division septation protein DedD
MTVSRSIRPLCAGLLGVGAALLVACGSSGKGLIPAANAGPLQSDFEAVAQAAQSGEGNCAATEAAIGKTVQDFAALPTTVDPGLRNTLSKGITNLRRRALALCAQPLPQATSSTSTPTTTTTSTQTTPTPTPTQTTSTPTTPPATTPTSTTPGGGTPAPGNESSPGAPSGPGGGTGIGGESGSGAAGAGGSGGGGAGTPGTGGAAREGSK